MQMRGAGVGPDRASRQPQTVVESALVGHEHPAGEARQTGVERHGGRGVVPVQEQLPANASIEELGVEPVAASR